MFLLRISLVFLIIYLIIRSFTKYREEMDEMYRNKGQNSKNVTNDKKISKEVGEYIDYEEVDN
jgi:hypothetical protein